MWVWRKFYSLIMPLEISHIVTNGCSFTYCQGLENPSIQGWPALLAKKLNVPVVNLGIKGSGNDAIYRRTMEYFYANKNLNSKPLYIIAFSQAMRREEFVTEYKNHVVGHFHNLATFGDEPIERAIFEHLNNTGEYFMEFKKLLYWMSTINLFKANNIPYITTNYMADHVPSVELLKKHHKNLYESVHNDAYRVKNFYEITRNLDKLPCGHDGLESQKAVTEYCYNVLTEKFGEIIPYTKDVNFLNLFDFSNSQPGDFFHYVAWGSNDAWLKKEINV